MRIGRAKILWIAAAIFGLAISLPPSWVYWETHSWQIPQESSGEPSTGKGAKSSIRYIENEPESIWHRLGDPVALGTFMLAIAAFWTATIVKAQVQLARDEFHATHRPEIIVHSIEVSNDIDDEGTGYGAHFTIANKGQATATIINIEGGTFVRQSLRAREELATVFIGRKSLSSGEEWENNPIFGNSLNTAVIEVSQGFKNPAKLWCIGRITYVDAGERTRRMGFCLSYDKERKQWVRERDSEYEYSY